MPASSVDVARLRECPFCGSSNVDLWRGQIIGNRPDNGMRFARCLNCGASTSCRERADAISSWNTRPEQDRLRVAAEKLQKPQTRITVAAWLRERGPGFGELADIVEAHRISAATVAALLDYFSYDTTAAYLRDAISAGEIVRNS